MPGSIKIKFILLGIGFLVLVIFGWWLYPHIRPLGTAEPGSEFTDFFPFGEERTIDQPHVGNQGTTSAPVVNERLQQISLRPVAGAALWPQAAAEVVVFIERATGHLYRFSPATTPTRLSQTTIPKIYDMQLGSSEPDSLDVFITYLKDTQPQHFWGKLTVATSSSSGDDFLNESGELPNLEGKVLPNTVIDWSLAPDKQKMLVLERLGNQIKGSVLELKNQNTEEVLTSRFLDWRPRWYSTSTISFQTKPSATVPGSLYEFNTPEQHLKLIFGGISGLLTKQHPTQNKIIYSGNLGTELVFGILDPQLMIFRRLPISTLADKCSFTPDGHYLYCGVPSELPNAAYPDDWYSGQINFTDNVWRINLATYRSELIFSPSLASLPLHLDLTSLFFNSDGSRLYFINKNDSLLWALDLTGGFE